MKLLRKQRMSNLRLNKIKPQTPISIIVHGANRVGYLTAKTLIDQGCYVVIIDRFNSETKKYLSELKKSELFDFFDFKGFNSLFKNIKRFDYLFYFLNAKLTKEEFDSKEFLNETKILEETLVNTKKNHGKFSLLTSLSLNRELANRVNNEKLSTPSPYSNMELQKYCETLAAEFKDKSNINLRILRLGTVIGGGVERVDNEILHELLSDSVRKNQITIKGEGLDMHSLIHEADATYGILKLSFSENTKGEVISLANKNDYTTLSLAYKLLELNTEAQTIRFVENPEDQFLIQDLYVPAPYATKYDWDQQMPLEEALVEQLQKYYESSNKSWDIDKKGKKKEKEKTVKMGKTKLGGFLSKLFGPVKKAVRQKQEKPFDSKKLFTTLSSSLGVIALTYFVIYPILGTLIGVFLINSSTKALTTSVLDMDQAQSRRNIEKLDRNINRVSQSVDSMYWIFKVTGQDELYDNSTQLILGAQYTVQGASELIEAVYPLTEYIRDFQPALDFQTSTPSTTREYRSYLEEIEKNSYKLEEASYKIALASQVINNLNTTVFPHSLQDKILEIKDIITQLEEGTKSFKEINSFLPDLLGVSGRKRYLILLQNETEIRSTGGWLTSYGIIGIEGGQIRELFVDDIYNADGTLRVQNKRYTPPRSMSNALEITQWPFSLVNWYPDLSDTLNEAEPFVRDLGKGNTLDGLITIDVTFVQKLLKRWGGIEVPGETELITSENLHSRIFQMHEEFTPGSTQKTTFLANLANEVVKKILSMNVEELIEIGDIFESTLNEKHLQATFKNRSAFNFFSTQNWANAMSSDYNNAPIAIDWNWGGNKANLYLDKNHNLIINIKDTDTIDFTYSLTVENSSSSEEYPEGEYINYQRIYVPSGAQVMRVSGIEKNEYTVYREGGFKVIGGWFNVPIKSTNTLEISYRLERIDQTSNFPITLQEQNAFFDVNLFKQPGEKRHAYKLDISYPSTWNLESSKELNSISNQLSGRFELNQDLEFPITWRIPN
jgi:nucleoside-diphosphate-sugar epimerase